MSSSRPAWVQLEGYGLAWWPSHKAWSYPDDPPDPVTEPPTRGAVVHVAVAPKAKAAIGDTLNVLFTPGVGEPDCIEDGPACTLRDWGAIQLRVQTIDRSSGLKLAGSVVEVWRFADLDADRVECPVDGPLCWYDDARYDLRLVHQDLAYWFWTPQGTPAHWLLTRLVEGRPSVLLAEGWEWGGREPPQFRAGCGLLTDAQVRRLVDGPAPKRTLRGLLDRWRRRGS